MVRTYPVLFYIKLLRILVVVLLACAQRCPKQRLASILTISQISWGQVVYGVGVWEPSATKDRAVVGINPSRKLKPDHEEETQLNRGWGLRNKQERATREQVGSSSSESVNTSVRGRENRQSEITKRKRQEERGNIKAVLKPGVGSAARQ